MRVLLVEDDAALGNAVSEQVADQGHAVDWAQTVSDANAYLDAAAYELILLDLMLPDGSGLSFLRDLRRDGAKVPVIILTARDRISERIEGLNAGADDYLVKPFDLSELSARIAAVARRYAGNPNPVVSIGPLEVDLAAHVLRREGKAITLTAREWHLLEALMRRPGTILSKTQLEESLYNFDSEFESNTIEVHISRLRKKLGKDAIETVRGLGYRLNTTVSGAAS